MDKKSKIAVTGGIGSGKSTVCDVFREKGYPVIVADDIAKEILVDDENVKKKIVEEFGKDSYDSAGLNRKYLAEKVFQNPENVEKINLIVHPPTIQKINNLAREKLLNSDMVFVESALIFEAKMWKEYNFTILVASEDENKIRRVVKRDNVDDDSIIKRLANQIPDKDKRNRVDFVIENNSSIDDLKRRSLFILSLIKNLTLSE
ncbi:dephospho-CoA kinase [Bacteroidota bacterium]